MYSIIAEGLGRQFGDRWAVRDLNLQIELGEVFGLLGPNGAGKTTTMRMLAGLIAPSVGRARVCGYDVAANTTSVRERVGILTESPGLYENLSAEKNLEFFAKLHGLDRQRAGQQIERYLRLLGLWDRRKDACGTFSKGMKQKLSMARSLLHEPPVLIFDEPTSALDPEGAKQVRDFVQELKGEGRTVIYCTHNLAEAQSLCDRVAIIKRALIRVGTPRELQQALYGRKVEICVTNAEPALYDADGIDSGAEMTMNDLAVLASTVQGVGDVAVAGERLLVSMLDPEAVTPHVVRELVLRGADLSRVAEVEYPLETAYLDLISRYDTDELANHQASELLLQEAAV
ncbi:MAG: type transport system ATP-binding protein [Chloroflexia bacterium]|nr:type transport system ATP-binding protein [Chloroflexia bacterium]